LQATAAVGLAQYKPDASYLEARLALGLVRETRGVQCLETFPDILYFDEELRKKRHFRRNGGHVTL